MSQYYIAPILIGQLNYKMLNGSDIRRKLHHDSKRIHINQWQVKLSQLYIRLHARPVLNNVQL